jgi:hypothetical protein
VAGMNRAKKEWLRRRSRRAAGGARPGGTLKRLLGAVNTRVYSRFRKEKQQ